MNIFYLMVVLFVWLPNIALADDNQKITLPVTLETASSPQDNKQLTKLPLDKGLPVTVRVGVFYQRISAFDENAGSFNGTVDMRLRWQDPRLGYPAEQTPRGFQEYRGSEADEKLKNIWSPGIAFTNLVDTPSYQATSVRIFPDGWVEVMQRTTANFSINMDAGSFPFDRQTLDVGVEILRENTNEASLVSLQEDLDFSHAAEDILLDGWDLGLVKISRPIRPGWYGELHSALIVGLQIKRQADKVMAPIFIPLIASLLIPLVALWMNSTEDGGFKVEAFELANIIVGGLFAVIALNFTVNSAYTVIASGDNTVSRLFGLNYVTLGLVLAVVIFMYRFNTLKWLFGENVQKETFLFLLWALPVLAFGTAAAFILVATVS
jgi:hypothetical protein